jgi:hypothetical protein
VRLTTNNIRKRMTPPFTGAADVRIAAAAHVWLQASGSSG